MHRVAHGNQGQDRTEIARMRNSKFEKIYYLTGAASYSEDGKSTGEFDITRVLRSERERECVCVCDGDPRLHSQDENVQTRGGVRVTAQAITIQSGFRHCLLLKRDRNKCVRVRRTDND